ncbi:uncharacterized protein PAC_06214 [Phialocephala subalpina]|uniref:Uncharacterized protein n=1 Tax=Phialocephala subalpina TaxID=576137 RepID=A0A1L7WU78_9HELO|nr:uncharacterized protein PAC_06214 [Phialocephala subalpina]
MSVGFGFSVGDFIAAIELVGTVIDALRSSGQAGSDYRELVGQLLSLETALIHVKELEFEESQYAEVIALRQAAAQCRRTIDNFWEDAKRYQPALTGSSSGSKVRDRWMKIKWAVCKKDDLAKFNADLVGHTESIQLLLTTVQMSKADLQDKRQEQQQKTLAGRLQAGYFDCMQRLTLVLSQGKQVLDITSSVLRTNVKVFQMVVQIHQFITTIPGQVERQQPVYMIDALGKASPFHLEFALVSVLQINFRKYGSGEEKVARGDFAIQDVATKRDVDLKADWELCFFPGQRVVMSIILHRSLNNKCPKCKNPSPGSFPFDGDSEIDCLVCGLKYRGVVEENGSIPWRWGNSSNVTTPRTLEHHDSNGNRNSSTSAAALRGSRALPRRETAQEEVGAFRHVRIQGNASHLPCKLSFIGCEVIFPPNKYKDWIRHSLSHFENGMKYENIRPDFFVVEYMREEGLLSQADYQFVRW